VEDLVALRYKARNNASNDASINAEVTMRTTISLDDDLVETATEFTGLTEKTALIREALRALIHREASRRLARLGGSEPGMKQVPRRRPE
jgi:Arc/MetJ family transcription regulator